MKNILRARPQKMSDADFREEFDRLVKRCESVQTFSDVDDDKSTRISRSRVDAFYCARTYFPHYFSATKQAEFHPAIVDACQISEVPVVLTAQRGGAKSTIVSFLEVMRDFLYQREDFIVLNMDSQDRAIMYTMRILVELQHNARLKEDFGQIVGDVASAKNFASLRSRERPRSTRLMAWGDGMSMRGIVSEYSRPTKIINEDLQDRESAESEKRTNKLERYVKGDYYGAKAAKGWKFFVLGNVICEGSLVDRLLKDEDSGWLRLKFPAIVTNEVGEQRSAWPEQFSLEYLAQERKNMGDDAFEAEYMCEPVEMGLDFRLEWFKHWNTLPSDVMKHTCLAVIDSSLSVVGDNKAIILGTNYPHKFESPEYDTWLTAKGNRYEEGLYTILLDVFNRKCDDDELFESIYAIDAKWHPKCFWVDGTFGQKRSFRSLAKRYAIKYGRRITFKYYLLKRDKIARIKELAPSIKDGEILFPPKTSEDVKALVRQFVRLGRIEDDGPDATAELVERLEKTKKSASFHS